MKTVSAQEMRVMDAAAPKYGVSSMELMEHAGEALSMAALPFHRIAVFCGKGNNGGDGFVAARHLFHQGKDVTVVLGSSPEDFSGDAKNNFIKLKELPVPVVPFGEFQPEKPFDLFLDCILGTGIKGGATGTIREMIEYINMTRVFTVSADIPSGVIADTGAVETVAVRANQTVTFAYPKQGLYLYPGRAYAGEVVVADIRMPEECNAFSDFSVESLDFEWAHSLLPCIAPTAHKGDMGRLLTVAGSVGMAGAAYLSTQAAVKSGAGLVTLACPISISEIEMTKLIEAMVLPLPDRDGVFSADGKDVLQMELGKRNAAVIGCGMRATADTAILTETVINSGIPTVLDADALNTLALENIQGKPLVLTPHAGEFSRLSGLSVEEIEKKRLVVAREFSKKYEITLVLKGADTIVASPEGCAINMSGNPGMATGGSGDVLAGVIGALLSAKMNPFDAARLGVYVHGLAGDMAAYKKGLRGLTATDILEHLPYAFYQLEKGVWSLC